MKYVIPILLGWFVFALLAGVVVLCIHFFPYSLWIVGALYMCVPAYNIGAIFLDK